MSYSRVKTKTVAIASVRQFCWMHPAVYWWTFTFEREVQDKVEADKAYKPFEDLVGRMEGKAWRWGPGGDRYTVPCAGKLLNFWELQKRGVWHVHCLTNVRIDVNFLRPWMVARGWGRQMRVELVKVGFGISFNDEYDQDKGPYSSGWAQFARGGCRIANYLAKYLTKSWLDLEAKGKRLFTGSSDAIAGSTSFSWTPETSPYAYLWARGRELFWELFGRQPRFREMKLVLRIGYEDTRWYLIDPLMEPP